MWRLTFLIGSGHWDNPYVAQSVWLFCSPKALSRSCWRCWTLYLSAADNSALSRRHRGLEEPVPVKSTEKHRHFVADSTGLKLHGEGEWQVRQRGWGQLNTTYIYPGSSWQNICIESFHFSFRDECLGRRNVPQFTSQTCRYLRLAAALKSRRTLYKIWQWKSRWI